MPRQRQEAGPHASAAQAMPQMFKQLWKDVKLGRVLVALRGADPSCEGTVVSPPFGAVDKMNPDRTLSEDKQIVHDQSSSGVNGTCSKEDHPPALQPLHRQVARLILWWKAR